MDIYEKFKNIAELFDKDKIRIISHHDADGIASAGILCKALIRKEKKFHVSLINNLDKNFIDKLRKEENEFIVFLDMGSGQINNIENIEARIIVLDHHVPIRHSSKVIQINTQFFEINGSFEACASTLSFLLAIELDEKNWDLVYLFLAGVIGDRQHYNGFKGLNFEILQEAIKKGIVKHQKDIDISGKDVLIALVNSADPFFDGISGNKSNTEKLLFQLGIDKNLKTSELSKEKKTLLTSYLLLKLLKQGVTIDSAKQLIIEKYIVNGIDTTDFSNWINACGRMDKLSLGLALCLGDENAKIKAQKLREEYRKEVVSGVMKLKNSVKKMENIQYFYVDKPSFGGAYAGICMQYLFDQNKPTIALTKLEKEIKISSRGTKYLVSKGLDLALALRISAKECGGDGGGHKIASGATIPIENEEKFLKKLNEIIGNQLKSFRNYRARDNIS